MAAVPFPSWPTPSGLVALQQAKFGRGLIEIVFAPDGVIFGAGQIAPVELRVSQRLAVSGGRFTRGGVDLMANPHKRWMRT